MDNVSKVPSLTPALISTNQRWQSQLKKAIAPPRAPGQVQYAWRIIDDLRTQLNTLAADHAAVPRIRREIAEWLESVGEYQLAAKVSPDKDNRDRLRKKQKLHDPCGHQFFENTTSGIRQIVYREKDVASGHVLRCAECGRRWVVSVLPKELVKLSEIRAEAVRAGRETVSVKEALDKILK